MNHTQLLKALSESTAVSIADCDKVLRALEEILAQGLSDKKWKSSTFDLVLRMLQAVKREKNGSVSPEQRQNGN